MDGVRDLIPRHKSDIERTEKLKNLDKDIIRPIILKLLVWLQDGKWLVATEIRDILLPFNKELVPHIKDILRTNDGEWKYFLLTGLVSGLPKETILDLKQDLFEVMNNPSADDKASGVDEAAREILDFIY